MLSSVNKGALAAAIGMAVISASQAAEIKTAGRAELVTGEADETSQLVIKLILSALVIIGIVVLLRELAWGFLAVLDRPEEEHPEDPYGTQDTYSHYNRQDYYGQQGFRSLGNNESFVSRILKSIDPVESAFAMMNIEEIACRKRTVCELQKAASKFPIVGALLRYMSPSIRGLAEYKEAQEAGAGLEDCALLFAECPYSMLK